MAKTPSGAEVFLQCADAVIAAQREAGSVLPVSDPRVTSLIASVSTRAVFGTRPFSAADGGLVGEVSLRLRGLLDAYLIGQTKPAASVAAPSVPPDIISANARKYEAVVAPLFALEFASGARTQEAMVGFLPQTTPSDRKQVTLSIRHYQDAAIRMYTHISMLSPADVSGGPAYHARVMSAAADEAPAIVAGLTLAQRQNMLAWVAKASASAPSADRVAFEKMRRAFADTACTGLCAYVE